MDNDKKSCFFKQIDEIYAAINALEKQLNFFTEKNPCGECFFCCSKSITIPVTSMDLNYTANRTNNKNYCEADFIDFLMKKNTHEKCPNFDPDLPGCSIYNSRPIVCRTFGYAPESTVNIADESCCYYKKTNPLWPEMEKWITKFNSLIFEYYDCFADAINPRIPYDYVYLAQNHLQNGNIEKAVELYEKVEKIFVESQSRQKALVIRAKKFEILGDLESAVKVYKESIALRPADTKSLESLAFLEYSLKRHDSSVHYCQEALKYTQTKLLYNTMGSCYFIKKDFRRALESYDSALAISEINTGSQTLDVSILTNKAVCLERLGMEAESQYIFEKVIEMDENNDFAHLSLAITLRKIGKNDKAEMHLKKAYEINSAQDHPHYEIL